jgi:hypothetical protein
MLSVNRLREFIAEAQASIPSINRAEMVVDDSELTKFLQEHKIAQNTFLVAVLPQFGTIGPEDGIKMNNMLQFFILDKSTTKNLNHDQYLNMFASTQETTQQFLEMIFEAKSESDFCGIWAELRESGIEIAPVWRKADCNGWVISMDLINNM